jgi:hypothetical protein
MPISSPQPSPGSAAYFSSIQGPLISAPPQDPRYLSISLQFQADGNSDETTLDQVIQNLIDWINTNPDYSCGGAEKNYPTGQYITPTPPE